MLVLMLVIYAETRVTNSFTTSLLSMWYMPQRRVSYVKLTALLIN